MIWPNKIRIFGGTIGGLSVTSPPFDSIAHIFCIVLLYTYIIHYSSIYIFWKNPILKHKISEPPQCNFGLKIHEFSETELSERSQNQTYKELPLFIVWPKFRCWQFGIIITYTTYYIYLTMFLLLLYYT